MAHMMKTGKGRSTIPYSAIANLLKGAVRSYGALARRVTKLASNRANLRNYYQSHGQVSQLLLEALQDSLDGICREQDMVAVAQAVDNLCKNSTFTT